MAKTYKEIFEMDSFSFLRWLKGSFPVTVPESIETIEDMDSASKLMLKLSAEYSYINELAAYAKVYTRGLKRLVDKEDPQSKDFYEDMVDKKDAIDGKMKAIHQAYQGISRAITVKMENNSELRMTGNRYVNIA